MFAIKTYFYALAVAVALPAGETNADDIYDLPSWITDSPGFQNPAHVDSIKAGNGSVTAEGAGERGWLVFLNERAGHGIELELKKLSLDPHADDFLLISTWPLEDFKRMKMFSGKFSTPRRKIRIPSSKMFFLLYSAARTTASPHMELQYRRYGMSLELNQLPTERPAKKKEIVFEVQLKGKPPQDYSAPDFLSRVKEGVREGARRYCLARNISFNEEIPTEEMVRIHKVTPCPFEWPDRHVCASLTHSVFVSGLRIPDEEIILDYQLTADHLKLMWTENLFPELQELGIVVFLLPSTSSTITYWILIIGLVMICSFTLGCIIWKANAAEDSSSEECLTDTDKVKKVRRPKLELSRHQRVPSFIFPDSGDSYSDKFKEAALRSANRDDVSDDVFASGPIKNYIGSILFGANRAYEDDEKVSEIPSKSPLVK